jgi:hypothetical protein
MSQQQEGYLGDKYLNFHSDGKTLTGGERYLNYRDEKP